MYCTIVIPTMVVRATWLPKPVSSRAFKNSIQRWTRCQAGTLASCLHYIRITIAKPGPLISEVFEQRMKAIEAYSTQFFSGDKTSQDRDLYFYSRFSNPWSRGPGCSENLSVLNMPKVLSAKKDRYQQSRRPGSTWNLSITILYPIPSC